jgi:hypothetical protein
MSADLAPETAAPAMTPREAGTGLARDLRPLTSAEAREVLGPVSAEVTAAGNRDGSKENTPAA